MKIHPPLGSRRGAILVLAAVMLVAMMMFAVLVIDLGLVALSKNQIQTAADAAALAAAQELVPSARPAFPLKSPLGLSVNLSGPVSLLLQKDLSLTAGLLGTQIPVIAPEVPQLDRLAIERAARDVASYQQTAFHQSLILEASDIQLTHHPVSAASPPLLPIKLVDQLVADLLLANHTALPNRVEVQLRCDDRANCGIPTLFAPFLCSRQSTPLRVNASAALLKGYGAVAEAEVLPLAMDITIWRALRLGNGTVNGIPLASELLTPHGAPLILLDENHWNPQTRQLTSGSDGVWEVLLITSPLNAVNKVVGGLLGSLGLPKITLPDVATIVTVSWDGPIRDQDVTQQVLHGLRSHDLTSGQFRLPATLKGHMNASDATLNALQQIRGQPRALLLFETLSGTAGNTVNGVLGQETNYRIVGWGGCVITRIHRLGLINIIGLQPAPLVSSRLRSQASASPVFSDLVFRSPILVE